MLYADQDKDRILATLTLQVHVGGAESELVYTVGWDGFYYTHDSITGEKLYHAVNIRSDEEAALRALRIVGEAMEEIFREELESKGYF
jgi:hypothetical protein